ncbi:hypothetical protein ACTMTF_33535 [Nonomuraea sp. ZG12]|uniref:hypothetical protein n=1 Tax=Nonomuraea sp. ZG12 TaxID=3452207 RepID=UPI003F8C4F7C
MIYVAFFRRTSRVVPASNTAKPPSADNNKTRETMEMRKILATAATAATAGIMALGLAAAPAQASTTTPMGSCTALRIVYTDFDAVDVAAAIGNRDGLVSKADLRAAAAGRNGASPLLQQAANKVRRSHWFDDMDVYGQRRSAADGLISRDDLRGYFNLHCR